MSQERDPIDLDAEALRLTARVTALEAALRLARWDIERYAKALAAARIRAGESPDILKAGHAVYSQKLARIDAVLPRSKSPKLDPWK